MSQAEIARELLVLQVLSEFLQEVEGQLEVDGPLEVLVITAYGSSLEGRVLVAGVALAEEVAATAGITQREVTVDKEGREHHKWSGPWRGVEVTVVALGRPVGGAAR
jgi:hypothetical protein